MARSWCSKLALAVALGCWSAPSSAFNSEEHKLIGDVGASRVELPSALTLLDGVRLVGESPAAAVAYLQGYRDAKRLAVGFDDNDADR